MGMRAIDDGPRRALACALFFGLLAAPVHGQERVPVDSVLCEEIDETTAAPALADAGGQPAGPAPTPRHTGVRALFKNLVGDVTHLPSKENALWASFGGVTAAALHPLDDEVNAAMTNSTAADRIFKPGAVLGQLPTLLAASITIYVVGRTQDKPKVSHLGMDLIQALVISEAVVQTLKVATQRERPDGTNGSFPSGHSADTFAFATALERHLGWRGAVPGYLFASYVAVSRLPAHRHWLSDVVFGSSVGIIAGRTVTRHGREFPVVIAPTAHGVQIVYIHPSSD
jgi:membrane-associated phospholipid phosphatase